MMDTAVAEQPLVALRAESRRLLVAEDIADTRDSLQELLHLTFDLPVDTATDSKSMPACSTRYR